MNLERREPATRGYPGALETEAAFGPPDLDPSLSLLDAHFASDLARHPLPIRNYHIEPPVSDELRRRATPAAVLIPIVQHSDCLRVLLTRRHHQISYPGQICFPGGRSDPDDADSQMTALREAREEIGLDPRRVRVLGTLGDYYTQSGFRIAPVVALVTPPLDLRPSPGEVDEIMEMPLAALTTSAHYRIWRTDPARNQSFYALEYGEIRLTGPTVCLAMGFYEALARTASEAKSPL